MRLNLLLYMEDNVNKNYLGIINIHKAEDIEGVYPDQQGTQAAKASVIQSPKTHILYDFIRLKRDPDNSAYAELISN